MDRLDFIREVFKFCNVKDEDNSNLRIYDRALSTPKQIDWDRLFDLYVTKAEKRTLPAPKYFIDLMPCCIKRDIHESQYDGNYLRVFQKSGCYSDYVICGFGQTLENIKQKFVNSDYVTEVRMYPKEVTKDNDVIQVALIGDNIYPTDTQYKLIFKRG